jgi:hypothetical protein
MISTKKKMEGNLTYVSMPPESYRAETHTQGGRLASRQGVERRKGEGAYSIRSTRRRRGGPCRQSHANRLGAQSVDHGARGR